MWLIPGGILPDQEPDGNTVVFDAPAGLIVVDTGRHVWHVQAILTLAQSQHRKIVAVVNTHWHLDHISGNPALRSANPALRVYSSSAIDGALTGFLASSARENASFVNDPRLPEKLRADIREDLLTIQNSAALKPDELITESRPMTLGGRAFTVNLAPYAATSGDVWLLDERTGVVALGDLVTLPAPFLDTACPEGWRAALARITRSSFRIAVPGHGPPMTPANVAHYRIAFESFVTCANSARRQEECGASWADEVKPLLGPDPREAERAKAMAVSYIEMLRTNKGRSKYCEAPPDPR